MNETTLVLNPRVPWEAEWIKVYSERNSFIGNLHSRSLAVSAAVMCKGKSPTPTPRSPRC